MARKPRGPHKPIDEHQLRGLLRLKPTQKDCAAFFNCSEDTIERACRKYGGKSFADFRDENMAHTRFALVREAIHQATKKGNSTMLIFCLKNVCNWKDKVEETIVQEKRDLIDFEDDELDEFDEDL